MNRKKAPNIWRPPFKGSKLSHPQFLQIAYGYAHDCLAVETARQSGVSVRTVNATYAKFRTHLYEKVWVFFEDGYEYRLSVFDRWAERKGWSTHHEREHQTETDLHTLAQTAGPLWLFYILVSSLYEDDFGEEQLEASVDSAYRLKLRART